MSSQEKEQGKKCFVITPIGNENSEIFRKAKGVIESVVKPVLEEYGFKDIKPAYEINESGTIGSRIVGRIVNDDLVIANLTDNNPNVMYELAIRHVTAKPIIHICENGTVLPFDIKDSRTIFYTNDMSGVLELSKKLRDFVGKIDYFVEYKDNPVCNGIRTDGLFRAMSSEGRESEACLLQAILRKISEVQKELSDRHPTSSEGRFRKQDIVVHWEGDIDDDTSIAFRREMIKHMTLKGLGNGRTEGSGDGALLMLENPLSFSEEEIRELVEKYADRFKLKKCVVKIFE